MKTRLNTQLYVALNEAINRGSQEDNVWQNTAILLMLECGYIEPEWLLDILANKNVDFYHTSSSIHLFFTLAPHRLHLSITPELYFALSYVHDQPHYQRLLGKLTPKQAQKSVFKHLCSMLKPHECQYRTLKTLISSLSAIFARPEFSVCRGKLETTQGLTYSRFCELSSLQTLTLLSHIKRKTWLDDISQQPNFSEFASAKAINDINRFVSRLTPTVKKNGKEQKQLHTTLARANFVCELETFLQQPLSPYEIYTTQLLIRFLTHGNVKDFISIGTVQNYMRAFMKLDPDKFNAAFYSDTLAEFINDALSSKPFNAQQSEYLSYCINKLNVIAPELSLSVCEITGSNTRTHIANAQYVSYVEVCSVIQNLLNNLDALSFQTVYVQVFTVILAYFAGLRRMEIVRIRFQDFTLTTNGFVARVTATIEGKPKNDSARTVFANIPDEVHNILATCMKILSNSSGKKLDCSRPILAFDNQSLGQRVSHIIQPVSSMLKVLVGKDIVLHSLRHSYAMNTLMQYTAAYNPITFMLPSEMCNSRQLFNESLLSKLTCETLHEACENTRKNLGHKHFATTLQTYLAGTAFYSLFAPSMHTISITRKRLATILQHNRSNNINSNTEAKIAQLINDKVLFKGPTSGVYTIAVSHLNELFQKTRSNAVNKTNEKQLAIVFTTPVPNLGSLNNYLLYVLTDPEHSLHSFVYNYKAQCFEFAKRYSIDISSLGNPARNKLKTYLTLLNHTAPNYKGVRTISHQDIDRSQLRHVPQYLKQAGLWQALQSNITNTRPLRFRHSIDEIYLQLLTHYIKEN